MTAEILHYYRWSVYHNSHFTDMDGISEEDFTTVARLLSADDLQKLYTALGIPLQDVEKAEINAATTDVDLRARAVLIDWRKKKGSSASRQALLDALQKCRNFEAAGKLEEMWTGKGKKF